ncbi:nuclear pore complex protein Nup214-like isoform X1 [Ornithodoros turicata]|uniref:nuclear pore complex protein Nup214-like isoform X1 n=1 Tax=Ornithodoros turicata TaxID=34597 RepID=UPI0031393D28
MTATTGPIKPNPNFLFHPCRTLNLTGNAASVDPDAVNTVAASSRYGLIFVGYEKGVKICRLEDILNWESDCRAPFDNCPSMTIPTSDSVSLVALNADEVTLAVVLVRDSVPVADMYDVRGFAHQVPETRPFFSVRLSSKPAVALQDFAWNPVQCSMFAVCLTDGSAANYELCGEILKMHGNIPAATGARALAWSPKGKQVVIGKQDGSLVQYKPTMQEAKTLPPPTIFENPVQVMSVCWIAPTVFAAVYLPSGNVDDTQAVLVITAFSKTTPVTYTTFEELCLKTGTHPKERFWLYHQPDWGILMFASRNSNETAVLGCTSADKMKWEQWELDSDGRAEVPLNKGEDTFPLGFAVIYSSQRNIVGKLETWPPMPILLLFSTSGALSPFHMKNLAPGVPSLVRPPEPLCTDGQRKPMANAPHIEAPRLTSESVVTSTKITSSQPFPVVPSSPQFRFLVAPTSSPLQPSAPTVAAHPSFVAPRPITPQSSQPFSLSTSTASSAFTFGSSGGSSFNFGSTSVSTTKAISAPLSFSFSNVVSKPTASIFGVPSTTVVGGGSIFPTDAFSSKPSPPAVTLGSKTPTTFSAPASTAPTGSPFLFGMATTPVTNTAVSPGSAFSSVPKPVPKLLPSVPPSQQPLSTTTVATAVTCRNTKQATHTATSFQHTKKQVSEPSDPLVAPSESASKSISDNAIVSAIMEEITAFQKELKEFKEQVCKAAASSGTQADMNRLMENGINMEEMGEELKQKLSGLNNDVHMLSSLILEAFAAVEEGRTQELRNHDPRFVGLLYNRRLDPMTAQRLSEIRQLHQYLESQLRDVHMRLDLDWEEYMTKQKEKCRVILPSAQAMYEVIRHCRNTSQSLTVQVDALSRRIKEMKALEKFGTQSAHWDKIIKGNQSNADELSALADTLLWTSLSNKDGSKSATKATPLSLRKQAQLAEYFGQQSATPVRARVIGKLSESRLLSKLSLVTSESSRASEKKDVSSPMGADEKSSALHTPELKNGSSASEASKETENQLEKTTREENRERKNVESFCIPPFASTPVKGFLPPISGIPHVQTTAEPTRVPITKVIQVSMPPTEKASTPVIPSGLTITPITPPEAPALTMTVTKPTPTRTDAPTKPFGSAFISSTTVPTAPVFSFGKTTAPMAFNFGSQPAATKPGFVAVKSSVPGFASAAETKPEPAQEKATKADGYEDVTPSGSPQPVQKPASVSDAPTQHHIKESSIPTSVTPPSGTVLPAALTSTKAATTAMATAVTSSVFSFPIATTSTTSALFKLNFGQSGTSKKTSIFGNTPPATTQSDPSQVTSTVSNFGKSPQSPVQSSAVASSAAAAAAAFSFTAALAASREPASPDVISSVAVPVAKPTPISLPSTAVQTPTSSGSGAAVTTVADSALFHPVSAFGGSSLGQPTTSATPVCPVTSQPAQVSKDNAEADSCKVTSTADTAVPCSTVCVTSHASTTTASTSIVLSQPEPTTVISVSQTTVPAQTSTSITASAEQTQKGSTSSLDQTQSTTIVSPFAPTSSVQASPFGQSATLFGKPQSTPTSVVPVFGQSPPAFTQTASTSSAFGQAVTTTTSSPFWKPSATFGQPPPTSTSIFGQPVMTSGSSVFGQPASSTPSVFGQSSVFGSSQQSTTTVSSPFGQMSTTSTSGSLFGQKPNFGFQQTPSPFGQSESLFGQKTSFGQSSVPAFGQQQRASAFGEQSQEQAAQQGSGGSPFGGSGFLSGLGGKPSGEGAPKNVFGGTFGSGTQSTGLFGSQGASSFGSSFGGGAFSSGSFSTGGGSVAQTGFGAFQQQTPTKPAAFGGPPAFGGSPSFGGPPQFGGSPTFGSSPGVFPSPFGSPQQSPQQQHTGSSFSVFGNTEGPTFGSLAAQGQGVQQQQQQQGLSFGSTFGSSPTTPAFGSPGFGDQSAPRQTSAFSQWRQ